MATHRLNASLDSDGRPMTAEFVIYGTPGPQGSKAFRGFNKRTRKPILVEMSKKVKPWRQAVVDAVGLIRDVGGFTPPPMDGPLVVSMVFTLAKPTSAPKRTRIYATKYPDLSKLIRSTEDALTTAKVWADDARVMWYENTGKVYPGEHVGPLMALDEPGVRITIREYRLESALAEAMAETEFPVLPMHPISGFSMHTVDDDAEPGDHLLAVDLEL